VQLGESVPQESRRGGSLQESGGRSVRAPIVPTGGHRFAAGCVLSGVSAMAAAWPSGWCAPAGSGVGFAGWWWGGGPQPKRTRLFPNDEFQDGRPFDPELPRDAVKKG